jgi:predicted phage-related endonuclease
LGSYCACVSKGSCRAAGVATQTAAASDLGEATAGLFADGKITWKRSKDRLAPDLEKLGQDHPDLLTRYVKPVPGVRRFTIQPLRQTP